ncbi:ERCC4 domain-containing protein [Clostridium botulinum]|uniref:ERCC4 domain-containing protein n=1 Tax=Clostridium botulinum TaxID=1491 RepID=UPI001969B40F|nr:ERCC4 domain-containing protein [Clostridium botulinum]MBN3421735.1 hypothetical protein [Clostridium botulinum]MBY6846695.1 ERCC4 domain-containing protein [Clostridium botulinum]
MKYRFTDAELKKLMNNMVIIVDSQEKVNLHITDYFDKKKKKYIVQKLDQGDYSAFIESNEETKSLGVSRDWYFNNDIAIERKNSVDELAESIKDRKRFESEFLRLNKYHTKVVLMIEDPLGYENILKGNYISQYTVASFIGSLESFIARYDLNIMFINKKLSGYKIYKTMFYHIREILKNQGYIEKNN